MLLSPRLSVLAVLLSVPTEKPTGGGSLWKSRAALGMASSARVNTNYRVHSLSKAGMGLYCAVTKPPTALRLGAVLYSAPPPPHTHARCRFRQSSDKNKDKRAQGQQDNELAELKRLIQLRKHEIAEKEKELKLRPAAGLGRYVEQPPLAVGSPVGIYCEMCYEAYAKWVSLETGERYCDLCDLNQHRSLATSKHRRVPLLQGTVEGALLCEWCGAGKVEVTCYECEAGRMCLECDEIRHRHRVSLHPPPPGPGSANQFPQCLRICCKVFEAAKITERMDATAWFIWWVLDRPLAFCVSPTASVTP